MNPTPSPIAPRAGYADRYPAIFSFRLSNCLKCSVRSHRMDKSRSATTGYIPTAALAQRLVGLQSLYAPGPFQ